MKIKFVDKPTPIDELLVEKRKCKSVLYTSKLKFTGVRGFDVYNISHEFTFAGLEWIAGRVEKRNSEISGVRIFQKDKDEIFHITDNSFSLMQDPFVTFIDNEIVLGGTKIEIDSNRKITNWYTTFLKGDKFTNLKLFLQAPDKMKDVRLHKSGKIHLFTRPQGVTGGRGTIGYQSFSDLSEITTEKIAKAKLLTSHFIESEWGGVNQILTLKNGLLGIVGHIAKMTEGDVRHYYGMVFCFDPLTKKSSKIKIICERSDFPTGPAKREDLQDVVFLGGLVRNKKNMATIYTGLSDAEAYEAVIPDPFLEYEE